MRSSGEIAEAARQRFGEPNRTSTRQELRFGKNDRIAVQLSGDRAGLWYNFASAEGGRLFDQDARLQDLGHSRKRKVFEHDSERNRNLEEVLRNSVSVDGTATELYLRRRHIGSWPHSIRHCLMPFGLIAMAQDAAGNVRAAQIVYLDDEGRKSGAKPAKRTYSGGHGWHEIAAVRMPGRGEIILCEGVETGLSIWEATGRPVMACCGQAGIRSLRLTQKRITIARDGDRPGSAADLAIKKTVTIRARRHRVKVATPPIDRDFNDLDHDEIRRIITAAEVVR